VSIKLQIANGFYRAKSLPLSHQECVNFYPSIQESPGALSDAILYGTPGATSVAATVNPREINRGAHVMGDIAYFVNGSHLYSCDSDYTVTSLGDITGDSRVSMADNGAQLMILVPGSTGYIYTVAGGLVTISDGDFDANGNPQFLVFIDGYFACVTDTKQWIISDLNDGTSWNALDFGSAESDPDFPVAPVVVQNMLLILGKSTTEGFQNVGGAGFAFTRNGIFIDKGCFAPHAIVNANGTFFMVGGGKHEQPAIWAYQGNGYKKISHNAIDSYLNSLTEAEIESAFGFSYSANGASFVCFTFDGYTTFVYDTITGLWHERRSRVQEVDQRWRANSIVKLNGEFLVGDSYDGRIGRMSPDIYGEYGGDIIRTFSTQVFESGGDSFALSKVELTVESGVGNNAVPEPKMTMAASRDGKTWDFERMRGLGRVGEYARRVIWRGIGLFQRFGYLRFRLSSQVKPVIIKVEVE
jgi:hypothetical protein